MARTTLLKNNRTESVRLSKDVAFPESVKEVDVTVSGSARLMTPGGTGWDHWFERGTPVSDDFLVERTQPSADERDWP